ncbi:hypothetical protein [Nonomuraea africana]|uniref:hypothetical protein n=1 Tax=Nonomuraea africana TaxID=46171 RepID=UPI001CEF3C3A|nr:hypothetical protein [Nonomuraea africana]
MVPQLKANPRVTVESGVFTFEAEAVVLEGAERDAAFARAVEATPGGPTTRPRRHGRGRAPPCSTISTAAAACSACTRRRSASTTGRAGRASSAPAGSGASRITRSSAGPACG